MASTKIYESLFILRKCHLTITRLWTLFQKESDHLETNADYALLYTYYINLETVTFLDEFKKGFSNIEPEYKNRVTDVRKITAPILKRINRWKDLEKFRNNIIAHPWRHKGKFVVPNQINYNIPRNWFENLLLVDLMSYMWSMISVEFKQEIIDALEYVATLQKLPDTPADYSDLNIDNLKMAEEVRNICRSLNKKYFLKVMQYGLEKA